MSTLGNFPQLTSTRKLMIKEFLALVNFYRHLLALGAQILKPLYMTHYNGQTMLYIGAFITVKDTLANALLLYNASQVGCLDLHHV